MNWVVSSAIMWAASVSSYLLLRKSNLRQIPIQVNNFAMFFLPFIIYLITVLVKRKEILLSWRVFMIIVVMSILFSYLGNTFSLRGMNDAPNPGYSLIISKSYVVMTTIASIFLFDAELTLRKAIAITAILFCSILLTLQDNRELRPQPSANKWVWFSLAAFICWGMLSLASKYLLTIGVDPIVRLTYTMGIATILSIRGSTIKVVSRAGFQDSRVWLLITIGILTALLNYFMQISYDLAPNIGYVNAINLSSIAGVTVLSALIYRDELSLLKSVAMLGTTLGLLGLVL